MPSFWNTVEAAVVPSPRESSGLAALERVACGLLPAFWAGRGPWARRTGRAFTLHNDFRDGRLAEALLGLPMEAEEQARLVAGARRRTQKPPIERRAARLLELLERRAKGSRA